MRILIIARDYPGERLDAPSVRVACDALVQSGHELVLVARDGHDAAVSGLRVVSAAEYPPMLADLDPKAWLLQLNIAMFERAAIEMDRGRFDVVHAFGSQVAHAAISIRRTFEVPLIASLSPGRGDGDAQAWMMRDADRVVVASRAGVGRVAAPPARVAVVRSGPGYGSRLTRIYRSAAHAGPTFEARPVGLV